MAQHERRGGERRIGAKQRTIAAALATLASVASCASRGQQRREAALSAPRGMAIEEAPLTVELWTRVSGSQAGPLLKDASLDSNDRIYLSARASTKAHVYLVYCNDRRELVRYPKTGSLVIDEGQRASVPESGNALRLDKNPGREALYVIASRHPLAEADPQLDAAIASARPDDAATDCGGNFEAIAAGSAPSLAAPEPHPKAPRAARPKPAPKVAAPLPPAADPERPVAELVRGLHVDDSSEGDVAATSGDDGVVVLRFGFEHR
jgi:hypothetical protein